MRMIHIENETKISANQNQFDEFKADLLTGLSEKNKEISSKYFYDEKGSDLFNQITRHSDYYLTRCEIEILNENKKIISNLIAKEAFNLIELGPGEGIKTLLLIGQFLDDASKFTYIPVDISKTYLDNFTHKLNQMLPNIQVTALHSDYLKGLEWLSSNSKNRNLVLFLGSSIGNFTLAATKIFLRSVWSILHHGDYLLIGFDLRKETDILLKAYNDKDGITRDFNLNLLSRINKELGANIDINKFNHYATYNPKISAMESYIMCSNSQIIDIEALNKAFLLEPYEAIHVEYSHKYTMSQIENLATEAGFKIINSFTDSKNYFIDSLWQVIKN